MTYPDIFKRALALWWRTRILWPLGVLAALFGAGDYSTGNNLNFNVNAPAGGDASPVPPEMLEEWAARPAVQAFLANPLPFFIGLLALTLLWILLASLVGQLAHGAMIRAADVADQGAEARLGDALRAGAARLLPLFLLNLIVSLPALLIILAAFGAGLALVVQLIALDRSGGNVETLLLSIGGSLLCLVPLILIVAALSVALGFFARVAQRACVIEGRGPIASFQRSWGLVTRNFGNALLTWLTTVMLGAAFGMLSFLPVLAIGLPAALGFMRSGDIPWGAIVALIVYGVAASVLLGGWLTSFNSALWTVAYRAFAERDRAFAVPASYAPGD